MNNIYIDPGIVNVRDAHLKNINESLQAINDSLEVMCELMRMLIEKEQGETNEYTRTDPGTAEDTEPKHECGC